MRKRKLIIIGKVIGASSLLTTTVVNLGTANSKKAGSVRQGQSTKFIVQDKELVAMSNQRASNSRVALAKVKQSELPLPKVNGETLALSVSKPKSGVMKNNIHYTFTKWEHSNEGKIDWAISLSKGQAKRLMSGKLSGFLTTSQKNQKDVDAVTVSELNLPLATNKHLRNVATPKDSVTKNGVKYIFAIWNSDYSSNRIIYKAYLSKGVAKRTMRGRITGFLPLKKRSEEIPVDIYAAMDDFRNAATQMRDEFLNKKEDM